MSVFDWKTAVEHPGVVFSDTLRIALFAVVVLLAFHASCCVVASRRAGKRLPIRRLRVWETLLYSVAVLSVIVLGTTSFYAVLTSGAMANWTLLTHMVGAGVFLGIFPLIAILWLPVHRILHSPQNDDAPDPGPAVKRFGGLSKVTFWLFLLSGTVTAGTMLVSMLPLFGTETLLGLLDVHRYSGLLLVAVTLIHAYHLMVAYWEL